MSGTVIIPTPESHVAMLADADGARAVRTLLDTWEAEAGENSQAWEALGPQVMSVPFVVKTIRAVLDGKPTPALVAEADRLTERVKAFEEGMSADAFRAYVAAAQAQPTGPLEEPAPSSRPSDPVRAATDWLRSVTGHLTDEERHEGIALFDAAVAHAARATEHVHEWSVVDDGVWRPSCPWPLTCPCGAADTGHGADCACHPATPAPDPHECVGRVYPDPTGNRICGVITLPSGSGKVSRSVEVYAAADGTVRWR